MKKGVPVSGCVLPTFIDARWIGHEHFTKRGLGCGGRTLCSFFFIDRHGPLVRGVLRFVRQFVFKF